MDNKIVEMTKKVIEYATLNHTVLVRIDTQFNYGSYSWKLIGYGADGTEFEVREDLHIGITK